MRNKNIVITLVFVLGLGAILINTDNTLAEAVDTSSSSASPSAGSSTSASASAAASASASASASATATSSPTSTTSPSTGSASGQSSTTGQSASSQASSGDQTSSPTQTANQGAQTSNTTSTSAAPHESATNSPATGPTSAATQSQTTSSGTTETTAVAKGEGTKTSQDQGTVVDVGQNQGASNATQSQQTNANSIQAQNSSTQGSSTAVQTQQAGSNTNLNQNINPTTGNVQKQVTDITAVQLQDVDSPSTANGSQEQKTGVTAGQSQAVTTAGQGTASENQATNVTAVQGQTVNAASQIEETKVNATQVQGVKTTDAGTIVQAQQTAVSTQQTQTTNTSYSTDVLKQAQGLNVTATQSQGVVTGGSAEMVQKQAADIATVQNQNAPASPSTSTHFNADNLVKIIKDAANNFVLNITQSGKVSPAGANPYEWKYDLPAIDVVADPVHKTNEIHKDFDWGSMTASIEVYASKQFDQICTDMKSAFSFIFNSQQNTQITKGTQGPLLPSVPQQQPTTFSKDAYQTIKMQVTDKSGNPIQGYDSLNGKIMAAVMVSKDLSYYKNLDPIYLGNGVFEIDPQFSQLLKDGDYQISYFFIPAGGKVESRSQWIHVVGSQRAPSQSETKLVQTINGKQFNLNVINKDHDVYFADSNITSATYVPATNSYQVWAHYSVGDGQTIQVPFIVKNP